MQITKQQPENGGASPVNGAKRSASEEPIIPRWSRSRGTGLRGDGELEIFLSDSQKHTQAPGEC